MFSILSLIVSAFALIISGLTAWLTLFRKGKLLMTQPTLISFVHEGGSRKHKIFLRTLLYSTAEKGQVLENLYLSVYRNETRQNFYVWCHEYLDDYRRGSGLFVPHDGIVYDHHFYLSNDGVNFKFLQGNYKIQVYASLAGKKKSLLLSEINLNIEEKQGLQLKKPNNLNFDWKPDQLKYHSYIGKRSKK